MGSFLYGSQLEKVWPSITSSPVHWMYSSGRSRPCLHGGERDERLERRARRVAARDGAVHGREVRVPVGEALEVFLLDPADVDLGVERRVRRQGEDLARVDVHGDERAAVRGPLVLVVGQPDPVGERLLGRALEVDVDRQPDVVAGLRQLAELPLARDPPERVDEDAPLAANAAEIRVVDRLDPGLPDAVARRVALVGLGLELLGLISPT